MIMYGLSEDRALTEREVAKRLSISENTLRRWRKQGQTPIPRLPNLGRTVRYSAAEVQRYLDRRAQ